MGGRRAAAMAAGLALGLAASLGLRAAMLDEHGRVPVDALRWIGLAVAVAAAATAWIARAPAARRPPHRALDVAGGALAVLALATYWAFGNDVIRHHPWEHYHYYLGAKYFRELSYARLYACAAVAEHERVGAAGMDGRRLRDLATDRVVGVEAALGAADDCTSRFTPARWRAFGDDVMWFRQALGPHWDRMQQDHGFNPPPTWVLAGGALARIGPASEATQSALARIDPILLAGMLGLVGWAFGAHVLLVATVAWAVPVPGQASWTAGAFLRHDWLVLVVAAVCFARRGWAAASGVAIASAAMLRLFPALLMALPLLLIARRSWRSGRLRRLDRRFVAGVALGGAAWLAVSTAAFGVDSWRAFADHIARHRLTPVANHVGLRSVFAQSWEGRWVEVMRPGATDPFEAWKRLRRETFAAREPVYRAVAAGLLALAAVAGWRTRRLWVALAASAAVVPIVLDVSSYYCAIFVVLGLLAARSRGHEWLALAAVVASRAADLLPVATANPDVRYTVVQSLVFVGWAAGALALVAWSRRARPARAAVAAGSAYAERRRRGSA
jgi:hypothetical protein